MNIAYSGPRLGALVAAAIAALAGGATVAGCKGKSAGCAGAERCACYPNGTCNTGLGCFSNVCVNTSDAGQTSAGGAGGQSLPGSGGGGSVVTGTGGLA